MNWDCWREAFKKYLPADYVDNEIDRYKARYEERGDDEYLEDVQYMFEHVYQALVEKHAQEPPDET